MGGLLAVATPAFPCSVVHPLPTPEMLVEQAGLIVHARFEGLAEEPGVSENILARTPSQIRVRVLRVLKGSFTGSELTFNGRLERQDDWNDRRVPYDVVRRGGRHGNCFALAYKQSGEYLLLLNAEKSEIGQAAPWSPYWSPVGPTNEQVRGENDPWISWVVGRIKGKPGASQALATDGGRYHHEPPRLNRNR